MTFDLGKLEKLPVQPGVYIMKGDDGKVLYVGKAKNLRQRIKQYFQERHDGRLMIPFLVAKIAAIETIVVTSEKEALLLENNLIKEHWPRYNALLKDDKTYVALKINIKHPWPMVSLVRYKGKPQEDALYFGPYLSAYAARITLDLLNKVFPLRQCSDQELARRDRPCVLYEMKRCVAPCVGKCTKGEYAVHLERTIQFLKGQDKEVLRDLYFQMEQASNALEFEKAEVISQRIYQIEKTIEEQHVEKLSGGDVDALAIFREGEELILSQLIFREGKLLGSEHYNFSHVAQEDDELLGSFLLQHYERQSVLPHEILLPVVLDQADEIADILSTSRKRRISIITPQRGEKLTWVGMAYVNAKAAFVQKKDLKEIRERTLLEMQEKLSLNHFPRRIECFDNSHIQGTEAVAAMVAFTDGEKDTARYRKYKIKTAAPGDDYGAMYEVLLRRYKRAKEENDLPDLVIVDGGRGQLNVALKVMEELNVITLDVIGIAKEEGRHDRGMTAEQVFIQDKKDPIELKSTSPILFLLQRIRDEAHRVAITFHRKRRQKTVVSSALDQVPGIGPSRRKLLLKHFGSVKRIKEASLEELQQVRGLTQANIKALREFFRKHNL